MKKTRDSRLLLLSLLSVLFTLSSSYAIIPEDEPSAYVQSLNGTWKFQLFAGRRALKDVPYQNTDFDDSQWPHIRVPGNWELQGFEEPQYGAPVDSLAGIYRRSFSLPAAWRSRHVLFYSEGIAFGYELWINGHRIGSFESAFQRAEFDITAFVRYEQENVIAIRVYRDHYQTTFDCTDDWALSGIFRDVFLYAAPSCHIEDVTIQTILGNGNTPAAIAGSVTVHHYLQKNMLKNVAVEFILTDRGARIHHEVKPIVWPNLKFLPEPVAFSIPVMNARLWNAETPALYDLQIILKNDDERLQILQRRVGIRQVSIEGTVFKINNRPVKLRGVCRLEIHPEFGRASQDRQWIEDLQLMKNANINAIRMTHWPPHPRFLDLCDQYGFYIIDEVPFDFGDDKLNDALSLGSLLARAQNTIDRDKNHACVIIWGIGNEHPSTRYTAKPAQLAKLLDPARPVLYPDELTNKFLSGIPAFLDFYAPHYIVASEMIACGEDATLQKPVILTEYNHALDVAFDGLAEKWEVIEKYRKLAGGMIWAWSDQGLYRKVNGREVIDSYADIMALARNPGALSGDFWIDENTIMDSHGQYGTDGIVYADRTPQTDYWLTRKVYSPIKILEKEKKATSGKQVIELTCINRYDFLDLEKVTINWQYRVNRRTVQQGRSLLRLAPHDTGKISIPIVVSQKPDQSEHALSINVIDHIGRPIYEHAVRLLPETGAIDYRTLSGSMLSREKLTEIGTTSPLPSSLKLAQGAELRTADNLLHLKLTGDMELTLPILRVGRKPTMAERRTCRDQMWEPPLRQNGHLIKKEYYPGDKGRTIYCEYLYSRSDTSSQKIALALWLFLSDQGWIDVHYDLTPVQCTGWVQELGLAMLISGKVAQVQWLGDGPYPAFPYKSELSERGIFSLAPSDRYFSGNRMNVDVALLTDENRRGICLLGNADNICWEQTASTMMVSHNVKVAGLGTKGTLPRLLVPIESIGTISGTFRLLPLPAGKYPDFLAQLFLK